MKMHETLKVVFTGFFLAAALPAAKAASAYFAAGDTDDIVITNAVSGGEAFKLQAGSDGCLASDFIPASMRYSGARYVALKTGYHFKYYLSDVAHSTVSLASLCRDYFSDEPFGTSGVSYSDLSGAGALPTAGGTSYQGFYAEAIANAYSVSYDLQQGTKGSEAPEKGTYDTAFAVSAPTREGYLFAGWKLAGTDPDYTTARWGTSSSAATEPIDSDTLCANGETGSVWFKNLTSVADGKVQLEAQFTNCLYTLKFDARGGECAEASRPVAYYGYVGELPEVTLSGQGQVFDGWWTEVAGGDQITQTTMYRWTMDITAYAHFKDAPRYTIDLFAQLPEWGTVLGGGEYAKDSIANIEARPNPGYSFEHWEGLDDALKLENPVKITVVNNASYTAVFTANVYRVTFDPGKGELVHPAEGTRLVTFAKPYGTLPQLLSRTGDELLGWYTEQGGQGDRIEADTLVESTEDHTLYAHWVQDSTYTVVYDPNGATEGTMDEQTFRYDEPKTLAPNAFQRDFHVFNGWSNVLDGATYADGALVTNLYARKDGICRLVALWKSNLGDLSQALGCHNLEWYNQKTDVRDPAGELKWVVDREAGGVSQTNDSNQALQTVLSTNGVLRFQARAVLTGSVERASLCVWNTTKDVYEEGNGDSRQLTAVIVDSNDWQVVECRVDESDKRKYLSVRNNSYGTGSIITLRDMTWTPDGAPPRTITYSNVRGAEHDNPPTYLEGTNFTFSVPTGVITGYTFTGWSPAGVTERDSGNMLALASWSANAYTVKFDGNGGTGTMEDQKFVYDVPDILATNTFVFAGHSFKGWTNEVSSETHFLEDGALVSNLTSVANGTVTLRAMWDGVTTHRVTIDGVATNVVAGETLSCQTFASVTNGLTNVVCVGWVGTGSVPASGTGNTVSFTVTQDSSLTWLYQTNYWARVTGQSGGSVALKDAADQTLANELWVASGTNLTAVATPNEGWTFTNWVDAAGCELSRLPKYAFDVNAPVALTAQFVKATPSVTTHRVTIDGVATNVVAGETLSCQTFASVTNGLTNVVCVGWVGTGSVPASGTGNAVSFKVTQESSLTWLYQTNYWVRVTGQSGGSVALKDAADQTLANELWAASGTNLTAVATPDAGWTFAGWTDAETGGAVSSDAAHAFVVSAPNLLQATFEEDPFVETYPITYLDTKGCANSNPTNYTAGDEIEFEPLTAPAGWTFLGWDPEGIEPDATGPIDVTALWEASAGGRAGTVVVVPAPETTLEGTVTWSAKNLPAGMKIAAKDLTDKTYGALAGGTLYGTPTKPGTYVVKVTAKSGKLSETFEVSVTVGHYVDETLPLEETYGVYVVGTKTWLELGEEFAGCKATGLPTGLKFASKLTKDSTFGEVAAGTVYGIPTKPCTNCVTFTKTATETVGGKSKKVTHTASATFAVAAAPTWAIGTFNGRLDDGSGSVTLTVAATGKASGKIITLGKTWSFTAAGYEAVESEDGSVESLEISATAKSGKLTASVACTVASDGATGEVSGDDLDDVAFTLWRNEWKDKGATDKLKPYVGVYTVQLEGTDAGYGYLSLTLDAKGNCKATGKLPDGTSASATLPLVWQEAEEEEEGAPMAIWQVSPSAYKGGYVGGLLAWDDERKVSGDFIAWVSLAPTASDEYGEGFSRTMSASGAWYNKLATLSEYYSESLTFAADTPALDATVKTTAYNDAGKKVTTSETVSQDAVVLDCWGELTVSLDAKGTAFVVDQGKATKPVQDKTTKEWSYEGANDAALTIAFTKATGVFKGTFTCWYDYVSAVDETKDPVKETVTHTSKKVSYEGVMVLDETDNALRGYYLWERTGFYEDEKTQKTKTYKYKESRPVEFQ